MHVTDFLTKRTKDTSPLCVGLDPQLDMLPASLSKDLEGVGIFCKGIIDEVADVAGCIKLQMASFEVLGWEGMKLFWQLSSYAAEKGMFVIADGKRNDIGPTCEAYADAYLYEGSPIHALTVSPYLGYDGIHPFIERCTANDKGIFVLVKTSNPSSGDIQDLPVGDEAVHEYLAQLVESWGMHHLGSETNMSCVGAVVGATYPEEMTYLRTLMPHIPFLIPGIGAQGGTIEDTKRGFLPDGTGAIVSASRSIIYSSNEKDWKEAAGKAAREMMEKLQR